MLRAIHETSNLGNFPKHLIPFYLFVCLFIASVTTASAEPILQVFFLLILCLRFLLDFIEENCSGILVRHSDINKRNNVESYKNKDLWYKVQEIGNLKEAITGKGE